MARVHPSSAENTPRLAPVRRRVTLAKASLGATGALVFGIGMVLSRAYYSGHSKQAPRALSPPADFVSIVRANQLEAGIIAPAEAPLGAGTSVS